MSNIKERIHITLSPTELAQLLGGISGHYIHETAERVVMIQRSFNGVVDPTAESVAASVAYASFVAAKRGIMER